MKGTIIVLNRDVNCPKVCCNLFRAKRVAAAVAAVASAQHQVAIAEAEQQRTQQALRHARQVNVCVCV
jgi:hypothetical protein